MMTKLIKATLAFCMFVNCDAFATTHVFTPLTEGEFPETNLSVPFAGKRTIDPKLYRALPAEYQLNPMLFTTELVEIFEEERVVGFKYDPSAVLPPYLIPPGFPLDINSFITTMLTTTELPPVTGTFGDLGGDITIADTDHKLGHFELSCAWTPEEFAGAFWRKLIEVNQAGLEAVCVRNAALMALVERSLDEESTDVTDVTQPNVKALCDLLAYVHHGEVIMNPKKGISLRLKTHQYGFPLYSRGKRSAKHYRRDLKFFVKRMTDTLGFDFDAARQTLVATTI